MTETQNDSIYAKQQQSLPSHPRRYLGEAEAEDPNEEEYAGEGEEEEEMALDREIEAQNH